MDEYAIAYKSRVEGLLARTAQLERALELIAEHARLDLAERGIAEAERYVGIAESALEG